MANPFQYQASVFKKKNSELPLTFGVSTNQINKPQNKPAANGLSNYPGYNPQTNQLAVSSKKDGSTGYIQYPTYNKPDTNQPQYDQPEEFDYNKSYNDYLQQMQESQAQRYGQAQGNAIQANQVGIDQTLRGYEQTKQNLQGQIPMLEKRSNQTQDLIKKGLESVYKQGETSKSNIRDQSGETLRQQAQARREVDAKRNAIFAGNNTVDSFGFGGYQLEQSNADSDFLREQNKTLRARDQQLAEIDSQITSAEAQAQSQINNEIAKFEDAVRVISQQLGDNEIAKQNAIENAYLKLQDTLFQINDSYNTNTAGLYEKQLELMKAVQEAQSPANKNKDADALRQEYILRTEKSGFPEVYSAYQKIMNTSDTAAGDMSMIFGYMKLLDPQSVVREGEFATAQNSGSVPMQIRNIYNKALSGERLQPEQRQQFRNEASTIFNTYRQTQDQLDQYYGGQANSRGLDPYTVTGLYSGYTTAEQQPSIDNDPLGIMR